MTTFLKVGGFTSSCGRLAYSSHTDSVGNSVPVAVPDGEKTEVSLSGVPARENITFQNSSGKSVLDRWKKKKVVLLLIFGYNFRWWL